jgi:hypothetical protein
MYVCVSVATTVIHPQTLLHERGLLPGLLLTFILSDPIMSRDENRPKDGKKA